MDEGCIRAGYGEDYEDEQEAAQHLADAVFEQCEEADGVRIGSDLAIEEDLGQGDSDYSTNELRDQIGRQFPITHLCILEEIHAEADGWVEVSTTEGRPDNNSQIEREADKHIVEGVGDFVLQWWYVLAAGYSKSKDECTDDFEHEYSEDLATAQDGAGVCVGVLAEEAFRYSFLLHFFLISYLYGGGYVLL